MASLDIIWLAEKGPGLQQSDATAAVEAPPVAVEDRQACSAELVKLQEERIAAKEAIWDIGQQKKAITSQVNNTQVIKDGLHADRMVMSREIC